MSQITWDDSYSVGNDAIDAQHKEWIAIYNRLDQTMLDGNIQDLAKVREDSLQAMRDYTNYHFRQEEEYMKEIGYPDIVAHKRLHTDFDDQLYNYHRMIRNGELVLNTELISIIKDWLLNHILKVDMKYRAFLAGK
jgi:hemerythrin-like metal-binding protein